MGKVTTNISIDAENKVKAQKLFSELGMDLSTAINIFLAQAIAEQGMPFKIRKPPNRTTLDAIIAAEKDEDMHGPFDSIEELMEDLNA